MRRLMLALLRELVTGAASMSLFTAAYPFDSGSPSPDRAGLADRQAVRTRADARPRLLAGVSDDLDVG